jgi:hypothetical protein
MTLCAAEAAAGEIFPASYLQQRLYTSVAEHKSGEIITIVWRLTGLLSRPALDQALQWLVARHEALRSTLGTNGRQVVQHVHRDGWIEGLDPVIRAQRGGFDRWPALLHESGVAEPMDLHSGPLVRARLLDLGAGKYVLGLSVHHAFCDAWSVGVISRDLWRLYDDAVSRRTPENVGKPIQMGDYAAWEGGAVNAANEHHWREALRCASAATAFPRRARPTGGLRRQPALTPLRSASAGRCASLFEIARAARCSPAQALCGAALAALCSFGAGRGMFAVFDANRARRELHETVGCLFDIRALIVELDARMSFRDVLEHIRQAWVLTYVHPLPLPALSRLIAASGDASLVFDAALNLIVQTATQHEFSTAGGLQIRLEPTPTTWPRPHAERSYTHQELTFELVLDTAGRLAGGIERNAALHAASDVDALARRFVSVINAAPVRPDVPITELA